MAQDPRAASEPCAQDLYLKLCQFVTKLGPFTEKRKKNVNPLSAKIRLRWNRASQAAPVLTIKAAGPLKSPRVFKSEQVSKSRWHHEVKLAAPSEIDKELLGWLAEACALSA